MKLKRITKKQRTLQQEVRDLMGLLRLTTDLASVEPAFRTVHLESAKRGLITAVVLSQYLLMDEHLNHRMCREFFPERPYPALWRTKRFRAFNYFVLERLYLVQKVEFVRSCSRLPKKIYKDILALNDLRNALAHSFFPENRRVKPKWKGADIFAHAGMTEFMADMTNASDFFFARFHRDEKRSYKIARH